MIGDSTDMARRLRAVIPANWFFDNSPLLQAVLQGLGTGWSAIYALIAAVRGQARIGTASGAFLDMISQDFFLSWLPRRLGEQDDAFRVRIAQEVLRPRAIRAALANAMLQMTGHAPDIFEPARPADTGSYNLGGAGYGVAGGWGNLNLPYQAFVTVHRPLGGGIAVLAGYGTGGPLSYADLSMVPAAIPDAEFFAAVARVMPAATIAWTRIVD